MDLLVILVLSFGPAFAYAAILYWLDRFEKEPKRILFGAFAWGAFVATTGAIIWSSIFEAGLSMFIASPALLELSGAALVAPVVEETLKGLAVLLIFLAFRHEFDSTLDGIVYAGITALGFAATENVLYLYSAYSEDGWGGLIALFVLRVILGGWGHAVYTAFIGIGLARARLSRNPLVIIGAPLLGWAIAVFLHGLHNGMATVLVQQFDLGGLAATLAVDWISWGVAFAIIQWEIRREQGWIRTYLQDEIALGTLSSQHYQNIARVGGRVRGWLNGGVARRFYHLCAELAQKKHQLSIHHDDAQTRQRVEQLRAEVRSLAASV